MIASRKKKPGPPVDLYKRFPQAEAHTPQYNQREGYSLPRVTQQGWVASASLTLPCCRLLSASAHSLSKLSNASKNSLSTANWVQHGTVRYGAAHQLPHCALPSILARVSLKSRRLTKNTFPFTPGVCGRLSPRHEGVDQSLRYRTYELALKPVLAVTRADILTGPDHDYGQ